MELGFIKNIGCTGLGRKTRRIRHYLKSQMLKNAMSVLGLFTRSQTELGVTEVSEHLEKPKSTISRWLSAMEDAGFLDRDAATRRYRVSLRLAAIGEMAHRATSLQQMAYPALERVMSATGETSNLVLLVGNEGTNVEAVQSPRTVAHLGEVGKRFPLYASAAGKALIAWRPEEEVRALTPPPLERLTPTTITDFKVLLKELAEVREKGWSVNWKEYQSDLVGVGAPVRDHRGVVVAALSISAPASRVTRAQLPKLGGHVAGAAADLSGNLGYGATA